MWYKNIADRFFGLATKHACDASIAASRGKNHFLYSAQLLNTDLDGGCDQHCRQLSEVYDTHRRTKLTVPETIICALHIKDNLRHHMTQIGIAQDIREKVVALVFGTDGVATSADESTFESRVCSLFQYVRQANLDIEFLLCTSVSGSYI